MTQVLLIMISDFHDDYYHGVMKGVVLQRYNHVKIIDVPINERFNPIATAWVLKYLTPYYPKNSVFLLVVDPGVGTKRAALVAKINQQYFIAPDNGIISPLISSSNNYSIHEITYHTDQVSSTFHGRDVFAPITGEVAKQIATNSVNLSVFGPSIQTITSLPVNINPTPLNGIITYFDVFGNIVTNIIPQQKHGQHKVEIGNKTLLLTLAKTFEDGPNSHPFLVKGSCNTFEIVMKKASAKQFFPQLQIGTPLRITPLNENTPL